jgi:hypothetical protein
LEHARDEYGMREGHTCRLLGRWRGTHAQRHHSPAAFLRRLGQAFHSFSVHCVLSQSNSQRAISGGTVSIICFPIQCKIGTIPLLMRSSAFIASPSPVKTLARLNALALRPNSSPTDAGCSVTSVTYGRDCAGELPDPTPKSAFLASTPAGWDLLSDIFVKIQNRENNRENSTL